MVQENSGQAALFGTWSEPDAAVKLYLDQKDHLHAGVTPRREGATVADICEQFFTWKSSLTALGELKPVTLKGYEIACAQLAKALGKHAVVTLRPQHFELYRAVLAQTWKTPVTLGVAIQRTRTIFKWAYDMELIEKPVSYGQGFNKPNRKSVRQHQNKSDAKQPLTTEELHRLFKAAGPRMQTFMLLGLNSAFGNTDISEFNHGHLKYEQMVVDYPRPKTAIPRTSVLWDVTAQMIRREAADGGTRQAPVFTTKFGHRYISENKDMVYLNFKRLCAKAELSGVPGFYRLRHTFRTAADGAGDTDVVRRIMGHAESPLDDAYVHSRDRQRFLKVSDYCRREFKIDQLVFDV